MVLRNRLGVAVAAVMMVAAGCGSASPDRTSTAPAQAGQPGEPAVVGQPGPAQSRPERPNDWVFDRRGQNRRPSDRGAPLDELAPGSVLDIEGELVCAHLEFALDALIADDTGGLNRALSAAGRAARDTGIDDLRSQRQALRGQPDRAEAEGIIYELLQLCVDAGYEI